MKVLLQRVSAASVAVEGEEIGRIKEGLLLFVGFGRSDSEEPLASMAEKIINLRVFSDERGKFQHSVKDLTGGILAIPQFTLYGSTDKGRRPDFTGSLAPESARLLFDRFVEILREVYDGPIATGRFGAHMAVELVNDGPVTLMLEK